MAHHAVSRAVGWVACCERGFGCVTVAGGVSGYREQVDVRAGPCLATGVFSRTGRYYDAFYDAAGKDYREESAELLERIRARCPEARTLLDVACGTGRHLEHLSRAFACMGLDLDPAMLRLAMLLVRMSDSSRPTWCSSISVSASTSSRACSHRSVTSGTRLARACGRGHGPALGAGRRANRGAVVVPRGLRRRRGGCLVRWQPMSSSGCG